MRMERRIGQKTLRMARVMMSARRSSLQETKTERRKMDGQQADRSRKVQGL